MILLYIFIASFVLFLFVVVFVIGIIYFQRKKNQRIAKQIRENMNMGHIPAQVQPVSQIHHPVLNHPSQLPPVSK